ncbi:hypothetical protein RRF57_006077 [Xylaria bambusicola]|uniref:Uncharacterized protein n=1 Tax=Xylaria bambusicola TaxID=326684 RepID=A0AAN7Z5A7_9PEZI
MSQGTSSQQTSSPTTTTSTSTSGKIITQAPHIQPSMEFPKPAVLQNFTTAPNNMTFTTRDADGNRVTVVLEDYDAPTPLGQRVKGSVQEAGVKTANCCLGCVCRACCGI